MASDSAPMIGTGDLVPASDIPDQPAAPPQDPNLVPASDMPDPSTLKSAEEVYTTPGQKIATAAEGIASGVLGPIAPFIEKRLGADEDDIRLRAETNPWTYGAGQAAGLGVGMLTNFGIAPAMSKVGELAGNLTQAGRLANEAREAAVASGATWQEAEKAADLALEHMPLMSRVGTAAVKEAAEMAVLGSSDEIGKAILHDPEQTATSAVANIGLASALGGAGGAFIHGAVSPLWKATIGPKVDRLITAVSEHTTPKAAEETAYDYAGTTAKDILEPDAKRSFEQIIGKRAVRPEPAADPLTQPHMIFSSENPLSPENQHIKFSTDEAVSRLQQMGFHAEKTDGMWEHHPGEPSIMVKNVQPEDQHKLFRLAQQMGQESALISDGAGNHEIFYLNGPNRGMAKIGKGTTMFSTPEDAAKAGSFSRIPGTNQYFTHNIDDASLAPIKNFERVTGLGIGDTSSPVIRAVADKLMQANGMKPVNHFIPKLIANRERATAIARAFTALKHNPKDPKVIKTYEALKRDVMRQWQAMKEAGVHVEFNPPGQDPYKNSSTAMIHDVRNNNHMWVFPTNSGFGSAEEADKFADHPLNEYTNEMISGQRAKYNDIFRAVHDYFGHAMNGYSFGPEGEENAWRTHMKMVSKDAQPALTTETRGQNSWVNFGPKAEHNRGAGANTIYADQKAGILPDWAMETKTVKKIKPKTIAHEVGADLRDHLIDTAIEQGYDEATHGDESVIDKASRFLGFELPWAAKGAMKGNAKAVKLFGIGREAGDREIGKALGEIDDNIARGVAEHVGMPLDEVYHSTAEEGAAQRNSFLKELKEKYLPIGEELDRRNEIAAPIRTLDEDRINMVGDMMAGAMRDVGTDSPMYKTYENYGQRILSRDTIGQLDKLKTEIFNRADTFGLDNNEKYALKNIGRQITDFQERMIDKSGIQVTKTEGAMTPGEIKAQRLAANARYAEFRNTMDTLAEHIGIRRPSGAKGLMEQLNKLSPEDIAKKFSPKGNVESIPFLAEHFPETLQAVRSSEAKKFLGKFVETDKGVPHLNVDRLAKNVEQLMKGSPEYAKFILSPNGIKAIQAGKVLKDAIPSHKSSNTASWLYKITKGMPGTAIGMMGTMMGDGFISSMLLGHLSEYLGREVPQVYRMAMLKHLANAPAKVDAEAFKGMKDTLSNIYRGEKRLQKGANAVFGGVVGEQASKEDREKLDKVLTNVQKNPMIMQQMMNSKTGQYLPEHQQVMARVTTSSVQYLQSLKPHAQQTGPLDKPTPISSIAQARYNRALDIANNPYTVLNHVKEGTLLPSDIQDLNAMFPGLVKNMTNQLSQAMVKAHDEGKTIPYKTRMGLSLLLGQPVDSTMVPGNIVAAQPQQPQQPNMGSQQPKKGSPSKMSSKSASMYQTAEQGAEARNNKGE